MQYRIWQNKKLYLSSNKNGGVKWSWKKKKKKKKERQEKVMLYVLIQLYWWPWFLMKILITYHTLIKRFSQYCFFFINA